MLVGYGQLVLGLSILVLLHELGHFLPAKWFKMRVDKFYLFFDPWFSLFKFKKGGTEYGIGWLPLGGYVRIRGMVDESMQDGLESEPQPWEFRAKPAWQRLIVMSGGIIVNLLVAWVILSALSYVYGEAFIPAKKHTNGVYVAPTLRDAGFKNGDKFISLDGQKLTDEVTVPDISWKVLIGDVKSIEVSRNGELVTVPVPDDLGDKVMGNNRPVLFETPYPFVVSEVIDGGYADSAGFVKGDTLIAFNNVPVFSFNHGVELFQKSVSKPAEFLVGRASGRKELFGYLSSTGTIGVRINQDTEKMYELTKTSFSFLESIPKGLEMARESFARNVVSIKLLFSKNGSRHVGSVAGAHKQYGSVWVWSRFWAITANISLVLAFFNLLPIPGLDGGHIMFTLYEMVTRRKPSVKTMQRIQLIGMIIILSLTIFAFSNDIIYGRLS